MKHIHIGIVGSRRRNSVEDFRLLREHLQQFIERVQPDEVTFVSGGCKKGADRFAEMIADAWGIEIKIFHPDTSQLDENLVEEDPRAAYAFINYARNGLIAENSDVLFAMVASDRKGGTEDTIKKFKKCNRVGNLFII